MVFFGLCSRYKKKEEKKEFATNKKYEYFKKEEHSGLTIQKKSSKIREIVKRKNFVNSMVT